MTFTEKLDMLMKAILVSKNHKLANLEAKLDSLSPLEALKLVYNWKKRTEK